jgi:hypothetical protein
MPPRAYLLAFFLPYWRDDAIEFIELQRDLAAIAAKPASLTGRGDHRDLRETPFEVMSD